MITVILLYLHRYYWQVMVLLHTVDLILLLLEKQQSVFLLFV